MYDNLIKFVRIFLLVLIIIGTFLLVTQKFWVNTLVQKILSSEIQPTISPVVPDCAGVCVSFDPNKYFEESEGFFDSDKKFVSMALTGKNEKSYTDPATKTVVTFKLLTDVTHQARNPTFEVYVNEKLAGTVGGLIMSMASFSPDHRYFGLRTVSQLGCCSQAANFYVVDLNIPKVMFLLFHPGAETKNVKMFPNFETFIESYSWGENKSISLTAYSVGTGWSGKNYRISSRQIWSFDLTNPESIMRNTVLTQTLPE